MRIRKSKCHSLYENSQKKVYTIQHNNLKFNKLDCAHGKFCFQAIEGYPSSHT